MRSHELVVVLFYVCVGVYVFLCCIEYFILCSTALYRLLVRHSYSLSIKSRRRDEAMMSILCWFLCWIGTWSTDRSPSIIIDDISIMCYYWHRNDLIAGYYAFLHRNGWKILCLLLLLLLFCVHSRRLLLLDLGILRVDWLWCVLVWKLICN